MPSISNVYIYLENGFYTTAKSFGADGTSIGEIVFNTSMTGYQEIITDPSYAGQFITFTAPEIGIVGFNDQDKESRGVYCKGAIVRNYQENPSNFRSEQTLHSFLKDNGILGITNIDTREITKILRDEGAMMMIASTTISDKNELKRELEKAPRIEEINYIKEVGTKKSYKHTQAQWTHSQMGFNKAKTDKKIVAYDFGAKLNILNELTAVGLEVEIIPHDTPAEDVIKSFEDGNIGGVFLSNGPGDPLILTDIVENVKKLIDKNIPMFGICLGHQILSIAHGHDTYKLKFGHHGGNHPVKNIKTGTVEITAQNHNYSVPDSIREITEVTHINLFDKTIEGVKYKDKPIFSVQHHPESSPGPHESRYIFKEFADLVI